MTLLSIDPGKRLFGWALWHDGKLSRAGLVRVPDDIDNVYAFVGIEVQKIDARADMAIECPQVYRRVNSKGDPNDLIDVAMVAGACAAATSGKLHVYRPHMWKKQVPKEIMNQRTLEKLSEQERTKIEYPKPRSLSHNVLDAIGIGLHTLKRL